MAHLAAQPPPQYPVVFAFEADHIHIGFNPLDTSRNPRSHVLCYVSHQPYYIGKDPRSDLYTSAREKKMYYVLPNGEMTLVHK